MNGILLYSRLFLSTRRIRSTGVFSVEVICKILYSGFYNTGSVLFSKLLSVKLKCKFLTNTVLRYKSRDSG